MLHALLGLLLAIPKDPSILTIRIAEAQELDLTSTTTIAAYVRSMEEQNDLKYFYDTIKCESGFQSIQSGIVDARTGRRELSFGVAQIFLPAHKDITKEQALDPKFSIDWAVSEFLAGRQLQWTCFRQLSIRARAP